MLVCGDVLVDCSGPMLHVSANRPDVAPGKQGKRNQFRLPTSPKEYSEIAAAPSTRRFKYGFIMTYFRDSNYQMFVVKLAVSPAHLLGACCQPSRANLRLIAALQVVDLSRLWFLLKLVEASWTIPAGETLAIVVSGTQGGSAEKKHPGVSHFPLLYKSIVHSVAIRFWCNVG